MQWGFVTHPSTNRARGCLTSVVLYWYKGIFAHNLNWRAIRNNDGFVIQVVYQDLFSTRAGHLALVRRAYIQWPCLVAMTFIHIHEWGFKDKDALKFLVPLRNQFSYQGLNVYFLFLRILRTYRQCRLLQLLREHSWWTISILPQLQQEGMKGYQPVVNSERVWI